jgi:uncharacterized protein YpmB
MKKWGILILAILCIVMWQAVTVYHAALEPKRLTEDKALERAKQEIHFKEIEEVYTYYGNQAYVVIVGTNKDNENIIAFVPEKTDNVIIKKQEEGISRQDAIARVKAERNPKEIVSAKLGIKEGIPCWEIKYIDQKNLFTFYYLTFKNGTFLGRYGLQQ